MSEPQSSVPRPRIQGLSDLIFGLALSIGAIELIGTTPQNDSVLVASIGVFGFSFLILIQVWTRYTTITSVVPVESPVSVRLNMLLLFLVALEPYLFNLLFMQTHVSSPLGQDLSSYYGLDIGGMNLILAYFTHAMTREERKLIPSALIRQFKINRNVLLASGGLFIASAVPIFGTVDLFGVPVRFVLWILIVPLEWAAKLAIRTPSGPRKPVTSSPP